LIRRHNIERQPIQLGARGAKEKCIAKAPQAVDDRDEGYGAVNFLAMLGRGNFQVERN